MIIQVANAPKFSGTSLLANKLLSVAMKFFLLHVVFSANLTEKPSTHFVASDC